MDMEVDRDEHEFTKLERIGEGAYGKVYRGRHNKTGQIVALKKMRIQPNCEGFSTTMLRETSILKQLKHPNIVNLHALFIQNSKVYLVFEHLSIDLKMYLDKFRSGMHCISPVLVKSYIYQISLAVMFCHKSGVLHRDLKPQNILLSANGNVKVADFGLSRIFNVPVRAYTHEVVTLWYRAPELLLGATHYACPIDVWSLGCIFAELNSALPLFPGDSEIDQLFCMFRILGTPHEGIWPNLREMRDYQMEFSKWTRNVLRSHVPFLCSPGYKLLQRMLIFNPAERVSAKEIVLDDYFYDVDFTAKPAYFD